MCPWIERPEPPLWVQLAEKKWSEKNCSSNFGECCWRWLNPFYEFWFRTSDWRWTWFLFTSQLKLQKWNIFFVPLIYFIICQTKTVSNSFAFMYSGHKIMLETLKYYLWILFVFVSHNILISRWNYFRSKFWINHGYLC